MFNVQPTAFFILILQGMFLNSFYCFRSTLPPVGDLPPVQSCDESLLKSDVKVSQMKKIRSASDSGPHMEVAWITLS